MKKPMPTFKNEAKEGNNAMDVKTTNSIHNYLILIVFICIFSSFFLFSIPGECQTLDKKAITPNEVFATAELIDKTLDLLLEFRGINEVPKIDSIETDMNPMHVYQIFVAAIDMMIVLEEKEGLRPTPKIVATPTVYVPEDVKMLADNLLREVRRLLQNLSIRDYPQIVKIYSDKTPNDVFLVGLRIFAKIKALSGRTTISPNEVYSQMMRAVADVKSILSNIDPAQRYRIDAPKSPPNLTTEDAFNQCLRVRENINRLRARFDMKTISIPKAKEDQTFQPVDVFVQTQIIIAEMNLIKMRTGTNSATPLAIAEYGKTASDIHQQTQMMQYLLSQITPLQEMVNRDKNVKTRLNVGCLPILDHLPLLISHAKDNDRFKNLDVKVQIYNSWTPMVEDMKIGVIDACLILSPLAMNLFHEGVNIKTILLAHRDGSAITVRRCECEEADCPQCIRKISDLKEKVIAIPHKQATHVALLDMYLRTGGFSINDVTTKVLAPPNMESSMKMGKIDAFIVAEPFGTRAQLNQVGEIHVLTKDILHHHVECIVVVNNKFLQRHPAEIQEWINSLIRSGKYIDQDKLNGNARNVAKIAAKYLPHSPQLIADGLQNPADRISFSDLNPDMDDFRKIVDISVQAGIMEDIDLGRFIDDGFFKKSFEAN